ncbi:MAG TPA: META domain-containing protein [Candidatus Alistipes intestinigallinarum]|uniref:META domain-containing protein n=1 Tax=Candidatus Alistipes intestinigallinarum TaxID=2838440 RepID=A0A9D1YZA3_9BACT|nr:META domain-containing protein [Candidatus Alistipes intestinigallinarum]
MKSKLRLFALMFLGVLLSVSCSKKEEGGSGGDGGNGGDGGEIPTATYGWKLTSWNGGTAIDGYVYLQFADDGTFTLYQQIGESTKAGYERLTGTYVIENDPDSNRIISGRYSDDTPWKDTYIIETWTDAEIRWRAVSDAAVSIYTWSEIPDYVTASSVSTTSRSAVPEQRFL